MTEKQCSQCKQTKPISEFFPHNTSKDGYMGRCKTCTNSKHFHKYKGLVSEKQCVSCGIVKPSTQFNVAKEHSDGLGGSCKECFNTRRRLIREGELPNRRQLREQALELLTQGMKLCTKCKEIKPVECFYDMPTNYTGYHAWCSDCEKEHNRITREANRARYSESIVPDSKRCSRCKKTKSSKEFYRATGRPDGLMEWCKDCHKTHCKKYLQEHPSLRRLNVVRNYGLTLDEYNQLLSEQKGVCAICGRLETAVANGKVRCLAIDHSHTISNVVRGLLCQKCNHGLGNFHDDPDLLIRAAEYLRRFQPATESE